MYSSPPLHQLSSESRHCGVSLDCLISRIIHHLERSWPPWGPRADQPAGVLLFSKIDGLSDLQALRLPPPTSLGNPRQERGQQEMEKPVAPFWEDDEQAA